MYTSDFNGFDFLRLHSGLTIFPLPHGLDRTSTLTLPSSLHLPPSESSPHFRSSPGSRRAAITHTNLPKVNLSSEFNDIKLKQTSKPEDSSSIPYNSLPTITSNPIYYQCKSVEFRGKKVAAFVTDSLELICLPQAFELFLKHLVGGLHTVYTKLKRLEITPVICNVEQVRMLRGLGAIQPGVNRCKLITCAEFDMLYDDCTNSSARPGRPSKRVSSSEDQDMDVEEKFKQKRRNDIKDCPCDMRLYNCKSLTDNFSGARHHPPRPHFSNVFSLRHFISPWPANGSRSASPSFSSREERILTVQAQEPLESSPASKIGCLPGCLPPEIVLTEHMNKDDFSDSASDEDCDIEEDNESKNGKQNYYVDCTDQIDDKSGNDFPANSRTVEGAEVYSNFTSETMFLKMESVMGKLNSAICALVDAAKAVERRTAMEMQHIHDELVREKEKCMELKEKLQREIKKSDGSHK